MKFCYIKIFTAKTLHGPRLPSCTLHHDWSVENGASMMRVNSTYGRTYSTVYTVCYNIMYYIILSTDLPDGRMSPIRMSHYDTGSDSLESTSGVKADSSMIIQVHQDIWGQWTPGHSHMSNPGPDSASWKNHRTEEDMFYLCIFLIVSIHIRMQICAKVWHILKCYFHVKIYC